MSDDDSNKKELEDRIKSEIGQLEDDENARLKDLERQASVSRKKKIRNIVIIVTILILAIILFFIL